MGVQLKKVKVCQDAVILQDQCDDLRNGQLLKNSLVYPVLQIRKARHQRHAVVGESSAGFSASDAIDDAVNAMAIVVELEVGLFVQKIFEVQIRFFADQSDLKCIGLTDGLFAGERENLQVMREVLDREPESGVWSEHPFFLVV